MAPTLVAHVVADAGAFLKKAPLQEIGSTIYTLKDVVDEIRDKPTRRSLAFLPYQLTFREPHPEHIRHVTEFSKKTGDYPSLSATDIKVLALTYQLELEHVGSKHLKKEPEVKVNVHSTQRHPETPVNVAGFFLPSREKSSESVGVRQKFPDGDPFNSFQFWRPALPTVDKELLQLLNLDDVKMDSSDWTAPAEVTVGCLTTDFAMQNVLIQIGLHVLSVNGMLIKQARNYILRCHACFK
ncbi:RNA-binding protein NOB1 [Dissostichus eleginoides]|uniref:RNA-binding protein NOB1 n=1 Tax=Dissostichus eleginoides TaxID=100907 RepID=A0AAD9BYT2_DISEL|nr:RNA-binding protein NOB1 [Dissostichus eleginoides]